MGEKVLNCDPALTCQCTISYRYEKNSRGQTVAIWNEEPPPFAQMMWGRCPRCKLPYHTEFPNEEPA